MFDLSAAAASRVTRVNVPLMLCLVAADHYPGGLGTTLLGASLSPSMIFGGEVCCCGRTSDLLNEGGKRKLLLARGFVFDWLVCLLL